MDRAVRLPACPAQAAGRSIGAFASALLAVLAAVVSVDVCAQEVAAPEEVEAAYVHKFVGYVEWPPRVFSSPGAPIVIGVVGSDRIYQLLSAIAAGRPVQGRQVEVRRLEQPERNVHLVFVGRDAWKDLATWTAASREQSMVVATDAPQGIERGATLGFVRSGQRVRFEASLAAAEQSGIKLSARLLGVAERVIGASP